MCGADDRDRLAPRLNKEVPAAADRAGSGVHTTRFGNSCAGIKLFEGPTRYRPDREGLSPTHEFRLVQLAWRSRVSGTRSVARWKRVHIGTLITDVEVLGGHGVTVSQSSIAYTTRLILWERRR